MGKQIKIVDIFILEAISKILLKYNPRILGNTGYPLFNTEGTFYGCICLNMNYKLLCNRKQGGGLLGDIGITEEKQIG